MENDVDEAAPASMVRLVRCLVGEFSRTFSVTPTETMTEPCPISLLDYPHSSSFRYRARLAGMDPGEQPTPRALSPLSSSTSSLLSSASSSEEPSPRQWESITYGPVKAFIKVRRLSTEEKRARCQQAVFVSPETRSVNVQSPSGVAQTFKSFDAVFDASDDPFDPADLYSQTTAPLVQELFDDAPSVGLLVASGDRNSGKSCTMQGGGQDIGIFRRVLLDVFERSQASARKHQSISIALLGYYDNKIFDLLSPGSAGSPQRLMRIGSICSQRIQHTKVQNAKSAITMLKSGLLHRNNDPCMSFGHLLFSVRLATTRRGKTTYSQLVLCDLYSPRQSKCKEALNFNMSLVNLNQCIEAKLHNYVNPRDKKPVPIRQSRFTRLLRPNLIGSGTTVKILHLAPCVGDIHTTLQSLTCSTSSSSSNVMLLPGSLSESELTSPIYLKCKDCKDMQSASSPMLPENVITSSQNGVLQSTTRKMLRFLEPDINDNGELELKDIASENGMPPYESSDCLNLAQTYLEAKDPIAKSQVLDKAACLCDQSYVRDLLNVVADEMVNFAPTAILPPFKHDDIPHPGRWLPVPVSQWVPDRHSVVCLYCHNRFGFFKRRHHCRSCGLVYCYECCKPFPVPWSVNPERVCRFCIDARSRIGTFIFSHR